MNTVRIEKSNGQIFIYTPYNTLFVKSIKTMGARWDSSSNAWVTNELNIDLVKPLLQKHYGTDGTFEPDLISVKIKYIKNDDDRPSVTLLGYPICTATERDSGARMSENAALVEGEIGSGGSRQYWHAYISQNSIILFHNFPRSRLEKLKKYDHIEVMEVIEKKVSVDPSARENLLAKKNVLMLELEKINQQLAALPRPTLCCLSCGAEGQEGSYPFSTAPSTSKCDDCL